MSPRIEQICYTHCTYETAVLAEIRTPDVFGYSARASSLEAKRLKPHLTDVIIPILERQYDLPLDVPISDHQQRSSKDSPRRLFYYPDFHGYRVLGQVSYRTYDVRQRPGSFFAHFVISPPAVNQSPWPTVSCLQSWGSEFWKDQDDPEISFELAGLDSLADVLAPNLRAIDDKVLFSFLTTPSSGPFVDPGGIIPEYCRDADAEIRQDLLQLLIRGYLELDRQHESLLLVADPELAALLFYGILRLLPPSISGGAVSISTYETDLRSLPATLVATTFDRPEGNPLTPEQQQSAGFWLNTFLGMEHSDFRRSDDAYPPFIVGALAHKGWTHTNAILERLNSVAPDSTDDLERLTAHELLAQILLDPDAASVSLEESVVEIDQDYVTKAISETLAKYVRLPSGDRSTLRRAPSASEIAPELSALAKSRNRRSIFGLLLRAANTTQATGVIDYLLLAFVQQCPLNETPPILQERNVPNWLRASALTRLLNEGENHSRDILSTCEWEPTLRAFLEGASANEMYLLYSTLAAGDSEYKQHRIRTYIDVLLNDPEKCTTKEALEQILATFTDIEVEDYIVAFPKLVDHCPPKRIQGILNSFFDCFPLPRWAKRFRQRIGILQELLPRGAARLSPDQNRGYGEWRELLDHLITLCNTMHDVLAIQSQDKSYATEDGKFWWTRKCRGIVDRSGEYSVMQPLSLTERMELMVSLFDSIATGYIGSRDLVRNALFLQYLRPVLGKEMSQLSTEVASSKQSQESKTRLLFEFPKWLGQFITLEVDVTIQKNSKEYRHRITMSKSDPNSDVEIKTQYKSVGSPLTDIESIDVFLTFNSRFWRDPLRSRRCSNPLKDDTVKCGYDYLVTLKDQFFNTQDDPAFMERLAATIRRCQTSGSGP